MIDLRPVGYIVGLLTVMLGVAMLPPMIADYMAGHPNWLVFLETAIITCFVGGLLALACANAVGQGLTIRQSFLLTTGVWVALPVFGSLPFMMGAPGVGFTDAFFEAMSGMTTTGTTVFPGLDDLPPGTNLWRGILQWLGGLGIIVVAMIFLPVMKVGGMQYFRAEGFDTLGKILPRALDISVALIRIYVVLTAICGVTYFALGMPAFDALVHSLTTIATGGFSTRDASFVPFAGNIEYAATVFMILAGLPFIRYIQVSAGTVTPLFRDVQVRAYLRWTAYAVLAITAYRVAVFGVAPDVALRESAFNTVSLFSGTGYGSADVVLWGPFPLVVLIVVGAIGSCTASTGCSIKVFRYLVLFEAIKAQIHRIQSPRRVNPMRIDHRVLDGDVVDSVIVFFTLFILTFGITSVLLSLTGLQTGTAITAAWTAVFNIGPAFGPEVGPTGAVDGFPVAAKWIMIAGMLLGRLELLAVLVLFLPRFWRG